MTIVIVMYILCVIGGIKYIRRDNKEVFKDKDRVARRGGNKLNKEKAH